MFLASSSLMVPSVPWPMRGHCHLSLGSRSSRIHSSRHTSLICKDFPQITFATSRDGTPLCHLNGPCFPFFPGSLNNLRDAKPQVLFLEGEPDCNLVCLIPSSGIPVLQSLPSWSEPGAVWLRALAEVPASQQAHGLITASVDCCQLRHSPYEWCALGCSDSGGERRGSSVKGLAFELSCESIWLSPRSREKLNDAN